MWAYECVHRYVCVYECVLSSNSEVEKDVTKQDLRRLREEGKSLQEASSFLRGELHSVPSNKNTLSKGRKSTALAAEAGVCSPGKLSEEWGTSKWAEVKGPINIPKGRERICPWAPQSNQENRGLPFSAHICTYKATIHNKAHIHKCIQKVYEWIQLTHTQAQLTHTQAQARTPGKDRATVCWLKKCQCKTLKRACVVDPHGRKVEPILASYLLTTTWQLGLNLD